MRLFEAMSTQWRSAAVGLAGLLWIGLDYGPLTRVNEAVRRTLPRNLRRRWATVFAQLQTLETAAIAARNR